MEINYHVTEADFLNFSMYHVRHSKTVIRSLNIQRLLGPVLFLILSFLFSSLSETTPTVLISTFVILSVIWLVFYPRYFYNSIYRHTKKMVGEGENEGILGEHQLLLFDDGIIEKGKSGTTEVRWEGIKAVKEDAYYFYIYNSTISAFILPKRELADEQAVRTYMMSRLTRGNESNA